MNDIDEYIQLADAWGAAIENEDSNTANSLHDRAQGLFQYLRETNQEKALFDRADTTTDAACFFIASHLKERDQRKAASLYERLARSSLPFIAMSSKQILNEMAVKGSL
jgi:hypothetical protein